ncbi:MAG: hypothetical protein IPO00_03595 [Betaproteobacteria bacterium]|nr:hypothetical protein [Betaproteobacteria bacterium]
MIGSPFHLSTHRAISDACHTGRLESGLKHPRKRSESDTPKGRKNSFPCAFVRVDMEVVHLLVQHALLSWHYAAMGHRRGIVLFHKIHILSLAKGRPTPSGESVVKITSYPASPVGSGDWVALNLPSMRLDDVGDPTPEHQKIEPS